MLHLTTEINDIDFSNNLNIYSGNRFVVTSGDMQVDVGSEPDHGYHILFKNNGHVISDFHGVQAENFVFDIKNHNLRASFLVDPMAPFTELDNSQHPHFVVNMHTANECGSDCVHHNEHDHDAHGRGAASSVAEGVGSAISQILSLSDSIVVPVLEGNASVSEGDAVVNAVSQEAPAASVSEGDAVVNAVSQEAPAASVSEGDAVVNAVSQETPAASVSEGDAVVNAVSQETPAASVSEGDAVVNAVSQETPAASVSEGDAVVNAVSQETPAASVSEGDAVVNAVSQETPATQPQSRDSLLNEEDMAAQFGNRYFYF
ncbi:tandem repeat protein effector TRP47 [Ehrlichia chaffeensis]|uniref:tandem repeat protein effector TRP47 n=1 Tax=Ehrlichia chaffeensis TaxID=945 RepID=UPI000444E268|nr:tandem repeat protein effector TRP47 [Ehrlichia chaffeensis]AHX09877.1 putative immunodominant surface protein gp36 [Ehrlichia chaffeensis str. Wakulla]